MALVRILTNRKDEDIETGVSKPPLFCVEEPDSVNILIDGKDTINPSDDPFNFTIDLRTTLYRARSAKVGKCIIPLINNITPFNNQLQIKHADGITTQVFSLTPAFYNTTTLANELTSKINTQYATDGISDTVTTSFDTVTKTFSIQSVNSEAFFIVDSCSFITRGKYCAPFESEPVGNTPSKTTIYSSMAGMLYTRFITVHSNQLNYYSYGSSLTSDSQQGQNIVAILDCCSIYKDSDFDVSVPFAGNFATIETPSAPQLNVVNSQKNLFSRIDIFVRDEYGNNLQDVMNLGSPYPNNTLGISLWLEVRF